jgi:hypothetical protein
VIVGGTGIPIDRRANESLGLDMIAILLRHHAEQMQRIGVLWFQAQDFAVARFGFHEIAGLVMGQTAREDFASG